MNHLLEDAVEMWQGCEAELPPIGRKYTSEEQRTREGHLEVFLKGLESELTRLPRSRPERDAVRERIRSAFQAFGRDAIGLEDAHLTLLLGTFSEVGTNFGRQARRFDQGISTIDILQACRNTWTACALQGLMGRDMRVTPSIFAYSMLYPYSDNYMDDVGVTREDKLGFSDRFRARLDGQQVKAANDRDTAIWRLVGMIESEYDRAVYPQVFSSLLAIHAAQEQSLRLLRRGTSRDEVDVLRLVFRKGGTSVLADAFLANGSISEEQERFAYGWGIVLQLADDLQDVRRDCERGLSTLFSKRAGSETLDTITSRTLRFAGKVMRQLDGMAQPGSEALKTLIRSSSHSVLIRAAGDAGDLYSRAYLAELESFSPFRFGLLRERKAPLARRAGMLARLFEAYFATGDDEPPFPLLPSTLMPR
ncbi:MAG TPA: class 1 isoprenoid biosynthesis enzyme [Bryobacteraceae bacterium]|nr:class 1 isoprenoid biosynthesis enzyme [Bryobacteraceae bacterium]